ncbi:G-protein coupled receptor [Branchiostoma belcheri]|nr:G-protein coupled receptor [Branchiostoma belcheri]
MEHGNETAPDVFDGYDGNYDFSIPENMSVPGELQVIEDLRFKLLVSRVVLGVVYASILFVCTVGNLLLLVVMYRFKKARTRANRLLVNLVLSDLLTSLLCVTFNIDYYVVRGEDWVFGAPMCAVVNYVKTVSLYVSTNTLVTMAVDSTQHLGKGMDVKHTPPPVIAQLCVTQGVLNRRWALPYALHGNLPPYGIGGFSSDAPRCYTRGCGRQSAADWQTGCVYACGNRPTISRNTVSKLLGRHKRYSPNNASLSNHGAPESDEVISPPNWSHGSRNEDR